MRVLVVGNLIIDIAGQLHGPPLRPAMELATRVAAAACETPGPRVSYDSLLRMGLVERKERRTGSSRISPLPACPDRA